MENYYIHLSKIQNHFMHIDILTITAFMNKAEKISHLLRYAKKAKLIDIIKIYS